MNQYTITKVKYQNKSMYAVYQLKMNFETCQSYYESIYEAPNYVDALHLLNMKKKEHAIN